MLVCFVNVCCCFLLFVFLLAALSERIKMYIEKQVRQQDAYRQTPRGGVQLKLYVQHLRFLFNGNISVADCICLCLAHCRLLKLTAASIAGGVSQNTDR